MSTTQASQTRFHVYDWVWFRYGPRKVWAQVVEDRGPLGVKHRRLYRIRLEQDSGDEMTFEMPEDDLVAAAPDKSAIMQYLREKGLVSILQSNGSGGKDQPRVWLTFTPRGEVSHTFSPDRGLIGGEIVPLFSLYEGKVFAPKKAEVATFLTSFGLSQAEAENVIHVVGTAP